MAKCAPVPFDRRGRNLSVRGTVTPGRLIHVELLLLLLLLSVICRSHAPLVPYVSAALSVRLLQVFRTRGEG